MSSCSTLFSLGTLLSSVDFTCTHPSNIEYKQQALQKWSDKEFFMSSDDILVTTFFDSAPCEIIKSIRDGFDMFSMATDPGQLIFQDPTFDNRASCRLCRVTSHNKRCPTKKNTLYTCYVWAWKWNFLLRLQSTRKMTKHHTVSVERPESSESIRQRTDSESELADYFP